MSDLVQQFIQLRFNPALLKREFMRLKQRRLPEPLSTLPPDSVGQLAPSLLFRLWDAAGLNRLISSQKQASMNEQTAPLEFEVFSASSSFSAKSDETVGTLKDDTFYPSTSPKNVMVSNSYAAWHPITSVVMTSPSDCQSVGQGSFHPSFCPSEPTVQVSDCLLESGHSETERNVDCSYV
ncbi:hypothetical protein BY996DRAFT_8457400 [Phakopsora pachyrhizi]|nr:hypothetical protein BY996DRAFT_8457400 [Phakopsora pachyrhizi]